MSFEASRSWHVTRVDSGQDSSIAQARPRDSNQEDGNLPWYRQGNDQADS